MFLNVRDKISSCYLVSVIILSVEKRIMNLCDARELSSYHLPKQNTRHNLMVHNSIYVFERCYYIKYHECVCMCLFIYDRHRFPLWRLQKNVSLIRILEDSE